jgi:hypothetical protein
VTTPLQQRERFIASVRQRVAEKRSRLAAHPESPDSEREFGEKYRYLVEGLQRTFEAVNEPGLEVEPFGSSGLRIGFRLTDPQRDEDLPIVDREIRVSRVDATEEVHLVFGSFQKAERHATFKLTRPNLPRVEAAFVDFLIEGVEPPWLARRPRERTGGGEPDDTGGPPASREDEMEEAGQRTLELPFD